MGLDRNFREGDYVKVVKSWEYDVENGIPLYPPNSDVMDLVLGGEIGRIDKKCTSQYCRMSFDCFPGMHMHVPYFALEKVESPNQTGGRTMSDERKWIASDGVTELKPGMLVLGRDIISRWTVDIFSHIESDSPHEFVCAGGSVHTMCLPLEGNEHMAGTTLPIPIKEKPFEWGEKVLVWSDNCNEPKPAIFIKEIEGRSEEGRFLVLTRKRCTIPTFHQYCIRAPLDADAEQE